MYYYLVPFVNHRQLKRAAGIDPRRDLHFYNRWQSHQARRSPGWPHHSSHGSRHHNRARCQLPDILSLLFPNFPQFLGNFREIFGKLPIAESRWTSLRSVIWRYVSVVSWVCQGVRVWKKPCNYSISVATRLIYFVSLCRCFSLTFRQIRGSSFSVSRTLKGVVRGQLVLIPTRHGRSKLKQICLSRVFSRACGVCIIRFC